MAYATPIARLFGVAVLASNLCGSDPVVASSSSFGQGDLLAQCVNPPTAPPVDKATQQINQRARTAELSSRIA